MGNSPDNPYVNPNVKSRNVDARETPASMLLIPFACLLIGLVVGVSNLQGVEQTEVQIDPGSFVVAGHARASSLGNWILAIAWIVGGVIASICSLFWMMRRRG